ncbi:MAG: NUDIX hydrolase [Kiritimatiellae bacterium]|jgi:ADP-ribose pyrophosphatase|nr:NUDIX hydrolase [Kiritimatiellia bacterium]MDD4340712.1 NUDIX hydrolase [Kiritimatiellia bacterium]MDY0149824.1 NUDIX hydrolase [Kiritimatiellia bacterium]
MANEIPGDDARVETDLIAAGQHLRLVRRKGWEFVERPRITGIVVIVGTTRHGGLVLVTQWREPVGAYVVEWPAGLAGDIPGHETEALEAAARRELLEETGFKAGTMEAVMSGPPNPGISNEIVTFFRARSMVRTGYGGGRGAERIRTHVVPISWLFEWLVKMQSRGFKVDPKVLTGAYLLRKEMEEWMHD